MDLKRLIEYLNTILNSYSNRIKDENRKKTDDYDECIDPCRDDWSDFHKRTLHSAFTETI